MSKNVGLNSEINEEMDEELNVSNEELDFNISVSELEEELNKAMDTKRVSDVLSEYLKYVAKYNILTKEEEYEYAKRYRELHDEEAKNALFNHNLRLVIYIAKGYNHQNSLTFMDLIQEGNIGLITAIEKFDYSLGFRFSTYACSWIKQAITRSIANTEELIRLPVHYRDAFNKYRIWREKYFEANNCFPSEEDCENKMREFKIDPKYIWSYSYLDAPINNDEGDNTCLGDFIPSDAKDCESAVISSYISEQLLDIMNSVLTERESLVVSMYFGLDDGSHKTLEEVGEVLGVTRERIRQIRNTALRKLKHNRKVQALSK